VLAASCDPAHIPLIPEETDISIQNVLFRATVFCEEPFFYPPTLRLVRLEFTSGVFPVRDSRPWPAEMFSY
ncbi:hypothetical protein, partial [Cupriavidus taiwanensis]